MTLISHGLIGIIVTALCWGITDPLLKYFGTPRKNTDEQSEKNYGFFYGLICDILGLLKNWKYLLTFVVNQIGSALFVWTLSQSQVSLAIPITNSLKFIITFCTGQLLGERRPSKTSLFGLTLIIIGILFQLYEKESSSTNSQHE